MEEYNLHHVQNFYEFISEQEVFREYQYLHTENSWKQQNNMKNKLNCRWLLCVMTLLSLIFIKYSFLTGMGEKSFHLQSRLIRFYMKIL